MDELFAVILEILGAYAIGYWVYRSFKKIDLQEKFAKGQNIEQDFEQVKKFEESHKDLPEKSQRINEFKKKEF